MAGLSLLHLEFTFFFTVAPIKLKYPGVPTFSLFLMLFLPPLQSLLTVFIMPPPQTMTVKYMQHFAGS